MEKRRVEGLMVPRCPKCICFAPRPGTCLGGKGQSWSADMLCYGVYMLSMPLQMFCVSTTLEDPGSNDQVGQLYKAKDKLDSCTS